MKSYSLPVAVLLTSSFAFANTTPLEAISLDPTRAPTHNFELSKWKITLPEIETQGSRKGKIREIDKSQLSDTTDAFFHPQWFYTDPNTGAMTFVAPNEAPTTPGSINTRSELRAMLSNNAKAPSNNFALSAHPDSENFGAIGGRMTATLSVDNVSTSGKYSHSGAFSVVIGQIHGSNSEPLKISYRKLPEHEYGSLVWAYELNPTPDQQNAVDENGKKRRQDIRHNVFGSYNLRADSDDPIDGIQLGEVFQYDVNVEGSIMHLTFIKNPGTNVEVVKTYDVDLAKGQYQGHEIDQGYSDDWMYFKAGAYNQCNTKQTSSDCAWRGMDAGDYVQVSFYQLELDQ
jgi:poly(beta-D-mannuronate) lyase